MNAAEGTLLVSVEHADGAAGVYDVPGEGLWMTGDTGSGPGTGLQGFEPGREGLRADRVAVAGRLPQGAVSCELRDAIGDWTEAAVANGAWVAVIEDDLFSTSMVKFLAADGTIVPLPIPEEWDRRAVPETEEACAVCGSSEWEEIAGVEVFDFGDGDREEYRRELIACRRCGHRVAKGSFIALAEVADDVDREEARRETEAWMQKHFERQLGSIMRSEVEVYGPGGGPYELLGSSSAGGSFGPQELPDERAVDQISPEDLLEMQMAHRDGATLKSLQVGTRAEPGFTVESTAKPGRASLSRERAETKARARLCEHLQDVEDEWPEGEAAITLHLERRSREATAAARQAELTEVLIPIDGRPVTWTAARSGGRWVSVCLHRETQIAVFATGLEFGEVEVERLIDVPSQLRAASLPR